jgi:hypothetical protein
VVVLHSHLGNPVPVKGQALSSIWEAVGTIGKAISDMESNREILNEIIDQKNYNKINK